MGIKLKKRPKPQPKRRPVIEDDIETHVVVREVGNSTCVTLTRAILDRTGWKTGDHVKVKLEQDDLITVELCEDDHESIDEDDEDED